MLSTLSRHVEVRWLLLAVLMNFVKKGGCHMKGYVMVTGTAGLYSRAHLHWNDTVPFFNPRPLSSVLAPR